MKDPPFFFKTRSMNLFDFFNGKRIIGKYISPMDAMGYGIQTDSVYNSRNRKYHGQELGRFFFPHSIL